MTGDAFEIIKRMDIRTAETQLILRCAPFLAGLKTSNLLIVGKDQVDRAGKLLEHTKFHCFFLYEGQTKAVLLLYSDSLPEDFFHRQDVRQILYRQGYPDCSLPTLLEIFAERYRSYMQDGIRFPHEMGLFLGYPPEDVAGFIANQGKNCLYEGYWKVYAHPLEKMRLFQKFDQAKENLLRLAAKGAGMSELLADI